LPRWVGVVFPIVVGVGVIFAGVYAADRSSLPLAVALAATAGVGLASGAAVRWAMPDRLTLLRGLVAVGASLVGLLTVGLFTSGAIGILPRPEASGRTQWAELAELVAATGIAWLVLVARRRLGPEHPVGDLEAEGAGARRAVDGPRVRRRRPESADSTPAPAPSRLSAGGPTPSSAARESLGGWWQRLLPWRRGPRARPSGPSTLRRRRRSGDIRLKGATEHRCPYCLEDVAPGDRRGVVVCPVCHTPHHADCWAVTGTCQVPHAYRASSRSTPEGHPGGDRS
jgi:hypothetical protein